MNVLVYLVPIALALGGLGLAAFLWALQERPVRRPRRRRLAGDQRRRPAGKQAIRLALFHRIYAQVVAFARLWRKRHFRPQLQAYQAFATPFS